jgi:hypothetical protein
MEEPDLKIGIGLYSLNNNYFCKEGGERRYKTKPTTREVREKIFERKVREKIKSILFDMPLCQESRLPTHQRKPYGLTDHIINSIQKYKKGECYFANKIRNCNKTNLLNEPDFQFQPARQ